MARNDAPDPRAHGASIRSARLARVRMIRRRVVGGSVALFVALWMLIAVTLISGHDPALAKKSSSSGGTTATLTSSSTGGSTGSDSSGTSSGLHSGSGTTSSDTGSSTSSSSSNGSSSSGLSSVTTSQS